MGIESDIEFSLRMLRKDADWRHPRCAQSEICKHCGGTGRVTKGKPDEPE